MRARHARWSARAESLARTQRRLGNLRLSLGLALAAVAAAVFGPAVISAVWLLPPLLALALMIALHPGRERALAYAARAAAFYARGLARIENRWAGAGSTGELLRDNQHVYAEDLDLFGRGSLFERLSTARTAAGERILGRWLLAPGEPAEVAARQPAVRELSAKLDLRQDLAVLGEDIRAALDDRTLAAWGARPPVRFFPGACWLALALAIAAATTGIAWLVGAATLRPLFYVAALEVAFVMAIRRPVEQISGTAYTPARELRLMAVLLERLEREHFTAPALVALQQRWRAPAGGRATAQIRKLVRLVEWKEWAHNQIFAVIAAPLLWTPQFAMAIERWRQRCGSQVADWIAAVGEFEALCSLAAFAYERPDATFPELLEGPPRYEATALVHPLIAPAEAVANDVALGGSTRLWIVSGSNMSGKSTLLRAVGLSVVLAWAGAPVTAARMRVSRLWTGACLRASDSLADHRSRFYAEISRLKQIMDAAAGHPVLFLLDELLSGTNSHDRGIGAEALLKGLLDRGAIGLVTTHDLALTQIAARMGAEAQNVHFEDRVENGHLRWDYRLRPGVVAHGNALQLMRAIGLDV
jgi:hypothetical protein